MNGCACALLAFLLSSASPLPAQSPAPEGRVPEPILPDGLAWEPGTPAPPLGTDFDKIFPDASWPETGSFRLFQPGPMDLRLPPSQEAFGTVDPFAPARPGPNTIAGKALPTNPPATSQPPLLIQGLLVGASVYSIEKTAPKAKAKPNWPW